jgi:NAD+-dependent secondary alcohol dehydrogenase Adh1
VKAVRLHKYEQRPVIDDVPEPSIAGPLDVLVRIGGAGLCRTDLHIVEGQWADRSGVTLPYTIGHENAGWVVAVGQGVTNLAEGDGVILHPLVTCGLCRACRAGHDMHCQQGRFPGIDADGGMAELLRTSARACIKLDPTLQPAEVAALADAGLTAYHAAKKAAPLLYPGTTAVVVGAGGLGHIGIQSLAALTPATIVVIDPNPAALELAASLGAHHTVAADGSQVQQVSQLTGGQGAEVVLDFVGERGAQADAWQMTRRGGSHFVVGYGGRIDVETIDVISTERNVVGNLVGSYNDLAELMVLAAQGRVRLHTRTYPLEHANQAIDDLDAGRLQGRGILVP